MIFHVHMEIEIPLDITQLGIEIMSDELSDVTVRPSRKEVFDILAGEVKLEIRERIKRLKFLPDEPTIRALRKLYWKIGIDPTKTRPSSEALIRRLFRKGLPMINNMVDGGNLASARTFIPIGLYDMDMIHGELRMDMTSGGERFRGIGSQEEELRSGIPALFDEAGVIHLYPHRDCMRTRMTEATREVLIVSCGAKGVRKKDIERSIEEVKYFYDQLRS